ncbi:MAG: class I SAM-dependent RNA methyltransferase [Chthoniobacterales bacterium]
MPRPTVDNNPAILTIGDVGFGGKGVARHEGKVVFIPFVLPGEVVLAKTTREHKSFSEASLVRILQPSEHRTEPPCPYFGTCGGCSYQHATYPHQLEIKQQQVRDTLRRIGKLDAAVEPTVPSPTPFAYRNRITVHVQEGDIGFFAYDEHKIVSIERCPIASEAVNAELTELRKKRPRDGHYTLRERSDERTFRQTNDTVAELLANAVGDHLPAHGPLLIDAYCGSGFFLKRFVDRFDQAIGLEWSQYAVAAAQKTCAPHESYQLGDVGLLLDDTLTWAPAGTTLLLDPPAEGLAPQVTRSILAHPPQTILYISCNPSTLARDLGKLAAAYTVRRVQPFDMFPQTAEIEVLAILELQNPI